MPFWSSISIPGKPGILIIDASQNRSGWESEFCKRLFRSLQRSNLQMFGEAPFTIESQPLPKDTEKFNTLVLCSYPTFDFWNQLKTEPWLPQKLLALCTWQGYDPDFSKEVLESNAASAIVPASKTTAREAGLFYLKFFTELDLHSEDQISGKMIWFSFAKAKELLKKRRYEAKFNVRC